MTPDELKERTQEFALRVIGFVDTLPPKPAARVIAYQLIKAATSVGAGYRAACRAKSGPDFLYKIKVVEEESDEAVYWLTLILRRRMSTSPEASVLLAEAKELTAIFTASGATLRARRV